ncbi:winged helix-turn-helix transcriptional regulator [Candidatus Shapirobacteria bacterium]|nr:winged helix-turn-helix transcriptional regulator [Candidatus Shapirobacteria bacterium]
MLTRWVYSIETESERLMHCARQIACGFYRSNGFTVLPYTPSQYLSQIVTFPNLSYNNIPRFWEQVRKINVDSFPLVIDPKLFNTITKLLGSIDIKKPQFDEVKELWTQCESEVISEIYKVLPQKNNIIKKITIHPTSFGTSCSFNQIEDTGEVIMYLREGSGVHTITEAIITVLTRLDISNKLSGLWAESEMITDFLVTQTSIAKVIEKYEAAEFFQPTIRGTRGKETAKIIQESNQYYQKLGLPSFDQPFSLVDDKPHLFNKPMLDLSQTELGLFRELIKNQNQVVDFDSLGSSISKDEDDFSLYAISKTVQRLRDKFEANGISGSYIQTLRGKGYLLKN